MSSTLGMWFSIIGIAGGFILCGSSLQTKSWLNACVMFMIGVSNIAYLIVNVTRLVQAAA